MTKLPTKAVARLNEIAEMTANDHRRIDDEVEKVMRAALKKAGINNIGPFEVHDDGQYTIDFEVRDATFYLSVDFMTDEDDDGYEFVNPKSVTRVMVKQTMDVGIQSKSLLNTGFKDANPMKQSDILKHLKLALKKIKMLK